jgi:peroxiredoxin
MTSDDTRKPRYSRLPYAFALVGVALVVVMAWLNRDRLQPVVPGTPAPEFAIPDLDGEVVRLSNHLGEVVMVSIWATWCGPCRYEMPSMERLYQELADDGLEILAVSIDADPGTFDLFGRPGSDIQAFADTLGLTFPLLHNPSGDIQQLYQTTGVPETFLVGRDGMIYKKVAGGTEWDAPDHRELIQRLLAAPE